MSAATGEYASVTDEGLYRGLRPVHALAIVVGGVLGAAIYIRPAYIAQLVATPAEALAVWLAAGLFCLAGAMTYGELASEVPRSGGEYAFLRVTLGELPAFLYGWMRLTVGVGGVASMALAAASFAADCIALGGPWAHLHFAIAGEPVSVDLGPRQAVAVLIIGLLAALNIRGVGTAGRFQAGVTSIKVLALLALVAAVFAFAPGSTRGLASVASAPAGAHEPFAYSAAVLAGVSAYNGWANVVMVGGEVQNPRQTLRWALIAGICIAIALYLLANLAYLQVLSMDGMRTAFSTKYPTAPSVASRAASAVFGDRTAGWLPLLFLISSVGALHCSLLSLPRVLYAMALDGLLPRPVATVAASSKAPAVAIIVLAALAVMLVVFGTYDRLANMMAFGCVVFFALNAFGLLYWRSAASQHGVPFRSWRGWLVPTLFLGGAAYLLLTLIIRANAEIIGAVAVIGAGVPVYFVIRWRTAARR